MADGTARRLTRAGVIAAALMIATAGWADIAWRVAAHDGPLAAARTWPRHRVDAFLNPRSTHALHRVVPSR